MLSTHTTLTQTPRITNAHAGEDTEIWPRAAGESRDSSHLHCRLVVLLHEKDSSAGKKELAFLSMHELWALTSNRGLAPTPRASTQSNITSSLQHQLKRWVSSCRWTADPADDDPLKHSPPGSLTRLPKLSITIESLKDLRLLFQV